MELYLLAGALQTQFFAGPATAKEMAAGPGGSGAPGRHGSGGVAGLGVEESGGASGVGFVLLEERMLRRVVHCLLAGQHHTAAIVACQCFSPPDYASAIQLAQEHAAVLTPRYMGYLWEIPVLEKLIAASAGGSNHKALLRQIQDPELNEFNPKEFRHAHVCVLKMCFFAALFADLGSRAGAVASVHL